MAIKTSVSLDAATTKTTNRLLKQQQNTVTLLVPKQQQNKQKSRHTRLSIAGLKVRRSWLSAAHYSLFRNSSGRYAYSASKGLF
uniref:Uncharacterized protein n=1 Tax=Syphacia muris TaxID=451379 RepID=A0A0N5AD93_9BILA